MYIFRAARGNTSLESAVALTKELRWDIQSLGTRLARAVVEEDEERILHSKIKQRPPSANHRLASIISDIKNLLNRIEDAVPLINLAITTSGIKLSTTLPSTVSPSRLLQASTFLSAADTQYALSSATTVQVGPTFTLSLYMLFSGHIHRPHDEDAVRGTTWKEAVHKARVKLLRVPLEKVQTLPSFEDDANPLDRPTHINPDSHCISAEGKAYEFAYQLLLIEDLDDDRVHSYEDDEPQPGPYDEVSLAGIRETIPIHQISKIFYADTGKILNIGTDGETNNPVLLLKRDINASPPRRMMDQTARDAAEYTDFPGYENEEEEASDHPDEEQSEIDAQINRDSMAGRPSESHSPQKEPQYRPWRLPPTLDPEWVALEVYFEEQDSETDDDGLSEDFHSTSRSFTPSGRQSSSEPSITPAFANLSLRQASLSPSSASGRDSPKQPQSSLSRPRSNGLPNIKTSLSLLEMLIRLTSLQQFQQASHLSITDELLTFFLEESSTTGAGADTEMRKRVRRDARKRVGFDPYDESPIKRRGEDYLYQQADHAYAYDYNEYNGRVGDTGAPMSSPSHLKNQSEVRSSPGPMIHAYPYRSQSPRDTTPGSVAGSMHMRPQALQQRENDSNKTYSCTDKIPARLRDTTSPSPEPLSSPSTTLPSLKHPSLQGGGESQAASNPTTPSRSRTRPMALRDEAAGGRRTRSSPLGMVSVVNSVEKNDSGFQDTNNKGRNGNFDEDKVDKGQLDAVKVGIVRQADSTLGTSPRSDTLAPRQI